MTRREFFLIPLAGAVARGASGWLPLCDGKTLQGWKHEGLASWSVEQGELVGRQGPAGAVGELLTEKQWSNFELELEWKMKWPGNSGIWFRYSNAKAAYQADILDEPGSYPDAHSGSLYCMGKAFIAQNRDAANVKKDGWNTMRIRAAGDELTISQNGKTVVQIRDNTFPGPGSIGIQVHAGKGFEGMEIRVRKMRIRPLD
jgi:hypothetical protein